MNSSSIFDTDWIVEMKNNINNMIQTNEELKTNVINYMDNLIKKNIVDKKAKQRMKYKLSRISNNREWQVFINNLSTEY